MKRKYSLVGVDGNAYSLMAYTANAMKREGYSQDDVKAMYELAKSGDYNNLICVCDSFIQQCNQVPVRGQYESEEDHGRAVAEYWEE